MLLKIKEKIRTNVKTHDLRTITSIHLKFKVWGFCWGFCFCFVELSEMIENNSFLHYFSYCFARTQTAKSFPLTTFVDIYVHRVFLVLFLGPCYHTEMMLFIYDSLHFMIVLKKNFIWLNSSFKFGKWTYNSAMKEEIWFWELFLI